MQIIAGFTRFFCSIHQRESLTKVISKGTSSGDFVPACFFSNNTL
jgi:hypothetical protein